MPISCGCCEDKMRHHVDRPSADGRGSSVTSNQPHKLLFTSWAHQPAVPSGTWCHGNCEEVPTDSKNQRTCPAAERVTMETPSAQVSFQTLHHSHPYECRIYCSHFTGGDTQAWVCTLAP